MADNSVQQKNEWLDQYKDTLVEQLDDLLEGKLEGIAGYAIGLRETVAVIAKCPDLSLLDEDQKRIYKTEGHPSLTEPSSLRACAQQVYCNARDTLSASSNDLRDLCRALDDIPMIISEWLNAIAQQDTQRLQDCIANLNEIRATCVVKIDDILKKTETGKKLSEEFKNAIMALRHQQEKNDPDDPKRTDEDDKRAAKDESKRKMENLEDAKAKLILDLERMYKDKNLVDDAHKEQQSLWRNVMRTSLDLGFSAVSLLTFRNFEYERVEDKQRAFIRASEVDKRTAEEKLEKTRDMIASEQRNFSELGSILQKLETKSNVDRLLIKFLTESDVIANQVSDCAADLQHYITAIKGFLDSFEKLLKKIVERRNTVLAGQRQDAGQMVLDRYLVNEVVKTSSYCTAIVQATRIYSLVYEKDFKNHLSKEARAYTCPFDEINKKWKADSEAARQEVTERVASLKEEVVQKCTRKILPALQSAIMPANPPVDNQ